MRIQKIETLLKTALYFSVAVTAIHLVWLFTSGQSIDGQGLLFALLGYGTPIASFAFALKHRKREEPEWKTSDNVLSGIIFALFLAMGLHVTIVGILFGINDAFYNLPLLYLGAFVCLLIAWAMLRMKPSSNMQPIGKVLFALPLVALSAMIIHTAVVGIMEYSKIANSPIPSTSAPWWVIPLIIVALYLVAAMILFAIYAVYRSVQRKRA